MNLKQMTNSTKNGQTSVDQTFVAISDRGMFTLDTRLDGKIKTGIEKLYKTKTDFTQVATTMAGGLAVGSLNGEIRL